MAFWQALGLHALEAGIVFLVLAFTSSTSFIRPALLPVLAALSLYALPFNRKNLPTKLMAGSISMNTVGTLFQYLEFALISRWSFSAGGPTTSRGGQRKIKSDPSARKDRKQGSETPTTWKRLQWGLFTTTSWRNPATPWEVKNVPVFDSRDPKRVPSRASFLVHKLLTLVLCFLFIDLLGIAPQDPEHNAVAFAWQKVGIFSRLSDITAEDMAIRVVVTLVGWTSIFCVLNALHCILAILAVATGMTGVDVWPPMFGSLKDCYSIRQFWGYVSPLFFAPLNNLSLSLLGSHTNPDALA